MFKVVVFFLIAILTFLIGGFFQTVTTFISNTACTLGCVFLLYGIILFQKKTKKTNLLPFVYIMIVITVSSIINTTSINLIILYCALFILTPYTIYTFISNNIQLFDFKRIFKFALYIGLFQLPIILLQEKFSAVLSSLSFRTISPEDVDFGTFFFANDHAVCFFLLVMIIILLFEKTHLPRYKRIFFIVYFAVSIISADSNISSLLLSLTFAYYFILNLRYFFGHLVLGAIVIATILAVPSLYDLVSNKFGVIDNRISETKETYLDAETALNNGKPERSDVVLYYQHYPLLVWGNGPYTYYNPIKKVFPKFANFSLYLWFYEDLGILGILGIAIIYSYMYFRNNRLFSYRIIYLGLILIYSYFANTFSDLAFNIIFSIAVVYKPEYDLKLIARQQAAYLAASES